MMYVIAHNIRSLYNVGSIFRNAAAFSIDRLYLTGYTGVPPRKEIAKVALGAQDLVPWESGDVFDVIDSLQAQGVAVFGLETGDESVSLRSFSKEKPVDIAIVLGNEVEGIEEEVVKKLDGLIQIPMGKKRSLNVSVASGVALYALTNDSI